METSQRGLLAVLGLVAGCATNPDVVAVGQTLKDSGAWFVDVPQTGTCLAGVYTGTFNNDPNKPSLFQTAGNIEFTLVETNSGEYAFVESGAKLQGKSGDYLFSADIDPSVDGGRGACYAGDFRVDLVNGRFYLAGTDAAAGYQFYGQVEGTYDPIDERFNGDWRAYAPGVSTETPISQGKWQALWHAMQLPNGASSAAE
jgi:hypothetical protein